MSAEMDGLIWKESWNEKETASRWGEDMNIFLGLILVCVGVLIGILIVALMSANDDRRNDHDD